MEVDHDPLPSSQLLTRATPRDGGAPSARLAGLEDEVRAERLHEELLRDHAARRGPWRLPRPAA